jgi:hypothetical protein
MATTWQLLAQLDLLHQLQPPPSNADDGDWASPNNEEDEANSACG